MSNFKVTLEIDTVGDKQAMAALDTLAAKSTRAAGGTAGLGEATKKATREFGEHHKEINKISRAMEGLAVESLGAKAQVGMIAGELGKMAFGGVAMLAVTAGIFAITKAWEVFTERAREAKKAQEDLNAKIAEAANLGNTDVIRAEARKIQFGQPFDEKGKLVANSKFVQGAFEGSLLDIHARLEDAQRRFYSTTNGFAQRAIQQEIIALKAQAKPLDEMMSRLQSAGANVASQPSGNAGRLPTITTTATGSGSRTGAAGAAVAKTLADAYEKELARDLAAATKMAVAQGVESATLSGEARASILDGLLPSTEQISESVRAVAQQISDAIASDPILRAASAAKQMGEQMGHMLSDGLAGSLVSALDAGFERAFSGSGATGFIEGFGQAVLGALGSLMEQMGGALVSYGIAMTLFADGMTNPFTSGPAAIAAGAALVALGAALSAAVRGHGGGGASYGGGYSGGGSSGLSGIIDRGIINPDTYSQRNMATIAARPAVQNHFTVIGTNDPNAQRQIAELVNKSAQRGWIGPAFG